MKKTAKIVSALLVLVLMMAQVVCVSAAHNHIWPSVSISSTQTDHYERTVTVSLKNASDAQTAYLAVYKKDGTSKTDTISLGGTDTYSFSVKVRPNEDTKVEFVSVCGVDGTKLNVETYTIPANGYYDINSGSGSSSNNGVYDGLVSSGSSNNGNYWYGSNNGSNVWDYYDPNAWHGYYEETRKDTTTYFVTCRTLNVRKGAGTSYGKVGTLSRNTAVEVYSIENGWAVVEFNGHLRYVSARYLSR